VQTTFGLELSLGTAVSFAPFFLPFRVAFVEGVGQRTELFGERSISDAVENRTPLLFGFERPGSFQNGQVARNDRKIDGAALGHRCHRTWPAAFGQTRQQIRPRRVTERLEQFGIEERVDATATLGGLLRRHFRIRLVYLRHYASIAI
jgi:hypothetical protein